MCLSLLTHSDKYLYSKIPKLRAPNNFTSFSGREGKKLLKEAVLLFEWLGTELWASQMLDEWSTMDPCVLSREVVFCHRESFSMG